MCECVCSPDGSAVHVMHAVPHSRLVFRWQQHSACASPVDVFVSSPRRSLRPPPIFSALPLYLRPRFFWLPMCVCVARARPPRRALQCWRTSTWSFRGRTLSSSTLACLEVVLSSAGHFRDSRPHLAGITQLLIYTRE